MLKAPSYEQNLKYECITFIAIFGKHETVPRVLSSCMWQQYNNGPPEKEGSLIRLIKRTFNGTDPLICEEGGLFIQLIGGASALIDGSECIGQI